jgi:hypothetical protein
VRGFFASPASRSRLRNIQPHRHQLPRGERHDDAHSARRRFISVVYVQRGARKRIISAFEADDDDIADYMVTYAINER